MKTWLLVCISNHLGYTSHFASLCRHCLVLSPLSLLWFLFPFDFSLFAFVIFSFSLSPPNRNRIQMNHRIVFSYLTFTLSFCLLFSNLPFPPFISHFLFSLMCFLSFLPSVVYLPCSLILSVSHVIFSSFSPLPCSHTHFSPFISSPYLLSVHLPFLFHLLSHSLIGQWSRSCLPWENVCDTPGRWWALVRCHQATRGLVGGGEGEGGWWMMCGKWRANGESE